MARNIYIDDNNAYILWWGLYSRSVGVRFARSMQKIAGSRPVCTFFEREQTVCTRMYEYVLVYRRFWSDKIVIYQCMLVHKRLYKYILVHTCTYLYILVHTVHMPFHGPLCTCTYVYVLVQTAACFILLVVSRLSHDMVQGSTCSNTPYHGKARYGALLDILLCKSTGIILSCKSTSLLAWIYCKICLLVYWHCVAISLEIPFFFWLFRFPTFPTRSYLFRLGHTYSDLVRHIPTSTLFFRLFHLI